MSQIGSIDSDNDYDASSINHTFLHAYIALYGVEYFTVEQIKQLGLIVVS